MSALDSVNSGGGYAADPHPPATEAGTRKFAVRRDETRSNIAKPHLGDEEDPDERTRMAISRLHLTAEYEKDDTPRTRTNNALAKAGRVTQADKKTKAVKAGCCTLL